MAAAASDAARNAAGAIGGLIESLASAKGGVGEAGALARLLARYRIEPAPLVEAALRRSFALPGFDAQPLMRAALDVLGRRPEWRPLFASAAPEAAIGQRVAAGAAPFDDTLFLAMLGRGICMSPSFERLLISLRRALLLRPERLSPAHIQLVLALARQAANNEYAWPEDIQEKALVDAQIRAIAGAPATPTSTDALARAAMYRPPGEMVPPERLRRDFARSAIGAALVALLPDAQEMAARRAIPMLAPPADLVSIAVRAQYEANPYPRWLDINPPQPGESRARLLRHAGAAAAPRFAGPLDVMIAGCGTGKQAIAAAFGYRPDARVLAIDLSAASLAYAERQAARIGCRGIEFLQADILDLDRLARDFDVIESSGVLHHLADPLLGWRRLAARLKPGGLMQVALYSERARQDVVAARAEIARLGLPPTRTGIQRFRRLVIEAPDDAGDWRTSLRRFGDLYTTSGTRDLVFNVQEHRFTPRAIAQALRALDLDFAGPEMAPPVREAYRRRFPDDPLALDFEKLESFEADNPDVFAGMITFWCRRKN